MTELEKKIKAKIPGEDTGIEIRKSICDICTPSHHCGLSCYVKDGKVIRVEGDPDHPYSHGHLCTKGSANRSYLYREERIRTPLRRVGQRGEGKFEPISWEEAYQIIAEKLNAVKAKYGPESVLFYSGYSKWYRPYFQRFAYAFGSPNYGSDDSVCAVAMKMGSQITAGSGGAADIPHTNTFLGWNYDGYYSHHLSVAGVENLKKRGGKVIIIDIRRTPAAEHLADIFLHIKPGTDGALALGMAKIIIDNGWADMDYVNSYTHGFEEYKALADQYPLDKVCAITGLKAEDVMEATRVFATNGPACINFSASALVHHINGFNAHRAILCLSALTGNFDRQGGNYPVPPSYLKQPGGFKTRDTQFRTMLQPKSPERIGAEKFPLWNANYEEAQVMDLLRQLEEDTPYPVRAIFGLGMNAKMFPETQRLLQVMSEKLDFILDVDIIMTQTAKYADIVLPACTSMERSELKCYRGGWLYLTQPVIPPMYESKSDVQILFDLVKVMKIDDPLMQKGYDACIDWIIDGTGLTVADLKCGKPVKVPTAKWPVKPGNALKNGFKTPTGKFEFYCSAIAAIDPKYGLDPLPGYRDSLADMDPEVVKQYPYYLCTGSREAFAIHSRLHTTPFTRSLRPFPTCDINRSDAEKLGIQEGDKVTLSSPYGQICMQAHLTWKIAPGVVLAQHGYTEANVNDLLGRNHVDPYSGFPAYKGMCCNIQKNQGE